jgi:uncharacterized protein
MARPERVEPGAHFSLRVPLNIMRHTFKKGWRVRLALSPSFYPTLSASPEPVTITLKAGEGEGVPASALILPGRAPRDEDKRAQKPLPRKSAAPYVNPEDYFPVIAQGRADETTRKAYPVTINGKPDMLTRKVFDRVATNTAACSRDYGSIFRRRRISRWWPTIPCRSPASPSRPQPSNAPI